RSGGSDGGDDRLHDRAGARQHPAFRATVRHHPLDGRGRSGRSGVPESFEADRSALCGGGGAPARGGEGVDDGAGRRQDAPRGGVAPAQADLSDPAGQMAAGARLHRHLRRRRRHPHDVWLRRQAAWHRGRGGQGPRERAPCPRARGRPVHHGDRRRRRLSRLGQAHAAGDPARATASPRSGAVRRRLHGAQGRGRRRVRRADRQDGGDRRSRRRRAHRPRRGGHAGDPRGGGAGGLSVEDVDRYRVGRLGSSDGGPRMPLIYHRSRAAVVAALFGLTLGALLLAPRLLPAAEKRLITETDLFQFVWVADPRISPDGKQVVFVRVTVNKKKEGYEMALWIVPTDASQPARPFSAGPRDSSPRWSPDGRWIAFERSAEPKSPEAGTPSTEGGQIWLIAAAGGEAVQLTDLIRGAGSPVWSPDGRTIAFTARANDKDLAKQEKQKKGEKADEEHESDVRVISRAVYRNNGSGYLDPNRPSHLWTVAVPAAAGAPLPKPRQITHGTFSEREPEWSHDGSLLVFNSSHVKEEYYQSPDSDLWSVPAAGGEPQKVIDIAGPINDFALSSDGKSVAFTGYLNAEKPRSYNQPDLFVAPLGGSGGSARNLAASFDFDVEGGVSGDQHPPRGGSPTPVVWSGDGK